MQSSSRFFVSPVCRLNLLLAIVLTMCPGSAFATGAMTNGENHSGTIATGQIDTWTFTANQNDAIVLSIGEVFVGEVDPGFNPWIRLMGPDSTQLGSQQGALAATISVTAPLSGTYTVLVSSFTVNTGPGNYLLRLVKTPGAVIVPDGDQGGPVTTGENHAGVIPVGDLDPWTLSANKDDAIVVSIGEVFTSEVDPGFNPWIRIYGPNGVLLGSQQGALTATLSVTAPLTGSYTIVVSSFTVNANPGSYLLRVVKAPGTVVVSGGDEGGSMTNGANHAGMIPVGDLDPWTFTAAKDDAIVVSIGEVFTSEVDPGFNPWIRIFGPNGVLLGSQQGATAATLSVVAPLTGTYIVVVSSFTVNADPGSYLLRLAKMPGTFTVPDGDEGGPIITTGSHPGTIPLGDLDPWTFRANQGNALAISIGEVLVGQVDPGFNPWIRLFGPDGTQLGSAQGTLSATINVNAPLTGTYTVLVASFTVNSDIGSYSLTITGVPVQTPPQLLTVTLSDPRSAQLNWTAVPGATSYNVRRGVTPGGEVLVRSGIAGTSVVDFGLAPGGTYYYVVAAVNGAGESAPSNEVSIVLPPSTLNVPSDFDGDRKVDVTIYRPSNGTWYSWRSNSSTLFSINWGSPTDAPVPADYDGDGKTDIAVYRPNPGTWHILQSSTFTLRTVGWGTIGDVPVPADYDGDGKTDIAVYRPSTGTWYVLRSATSTLLSATWGTSADVPVPGYYDGDAKADIAVYRRSNSTWYIFQSSTSTPLITVWGGAGIDVPVAADYDGDGQTDLAVYRPGTGIWYIYRSSTLSLLTVAWGAPGGDDVPVPGDYDGDGKTDIAVFRPGTGTWFVFRSATSTLYTVVWGSSSDIPVLRRP
jgi:FG-GAP-like repeat/Fibronectin type III domain